MSRKKKGIIFVISSPSGGGKTTVCNWLKKERFDIRFSVSNTTRKLRAGEKDGRDYHFVPKNEFKRLIAKKRFLEWADNFGYFYGTPKGPVEDAISRGKDIILAIDVKGAMRIKKLHKDAVLIFLLPPSVELLKKRLNMRRTESKKAMARRLKVARKELTYLDKYDYAIVNDTLARAVKTLKAIIIAERNRVKN